MVLSSCLFWYQIKTSTEKIYTDSMTNYNNLRSSHSWLDCLSVCLSVWTAWYYYQLSNEYTLHLLVLSFSLPSPPLLLHLLLPFLFSYNQSSSDIVMFYKYPYFSFDFTIFNFPMFSVLVGFLFPPLSSSLSSSSTAFLSLKSVIWRHMSNLWETNKFFTTLAWQQLVTVQSFTKKCCAFHIGE